MSQQRFVFFVIDMALSSHIQTEVRRSFYFMGKGPWLGLIAALILSARPLDAQVPNFYRGPAHAHFALVRAAFGALLAGPSLSFTPQADGGGDGGGGGDGSGSD